MKRILILFGIVILLLITVRFISANGLIITQNLTNLTKISGNDLIYSFQIINADSFPFYNITVEPNNFISVPIISQLNSGQVANVNALITSNESFDLKKLKIQGYYYANVGISNQTYEINIDYYNGILPKCDFSIIKGDKIKFINKVADDIDLKNAVTGNIVTTIPQGGNYTTNFDSPQTFKYFFLRRGFSFTSVCTITTLNDNGLINNPEYDGLLNVSLNVIFNPTSITYNILEHNYSVNVFQSQDGVLTITNIGNQTARNILLSGEWLSYNANNFNLDPGQTKGVVYTLRPIITSTSQTNMSYTKNLIINGNFNTITSPFNIFVPYANLDNGNQSSNYQSLLSLLQQFCKENPNEVFCKDKATVVYVGNGTDQNFNVTYSTEQVKRIYDYIFKMGDDETIANNYFKETLYNISQRMNNIENMSQSNLNISANSEAQRQQNSGNTTLIVIIFIMLGVLALIITIIIVLRRYREQSKASKW